MEIDEKTQDLIVSLISKALKQGNAEGFRNGYDGAKWKIKSSFCELYESANQFILKNPDMQKSEIQAYIDNLIEQRI